MVAFETWWARCRGVSTLDTQGSPAFPASYCWLVAPVLDVPTVGTATSFTFDGEMAIKVTRCGVGVIHPPPYCRWSGLVDGHIIDWCGKWVLLMAIVTSNQPLSQAKSERTGEWMHSLYSSWTRTQKCTCTKQTLCNVLPKRSQRQAKFIELSALQSHMIVPTQLVSQVHSAHETIITGHFPSKKS